MDRASGGDFDTPANWEAAVVPGPADDVVINVAPGTIINHSTGIDAVNSLTSNGKFVLSGGSLAVGNGTPGDLTLNDTFALNGGTLVNARVTGDPNELTPTAAGGTLDGVTLASDLTVSNGTTFRVVDALVVSNATITIASDGAPTGITIDNSASQLFGTSGQLLFAGTAPSNNFINIDDNFGSLSLQIPIHGSSGTINSSGFGGTTFIQAPITSDMPGEKIVIAGDQVQNQSALTAINGGTLDLEASVMGTINETNSTLIFGGVLSTIGNVVQHGGTINLTGIIDAQGGTIAFNSSTGSWNLVGGTVRNATVIFNGASLIPTSAGGTFSNVDLTSDLELVPQAIVTVTDGLTLDASLQIDAGATLTFDSTEVAQTVSGGGQVVLNGGTLNSEDSGPNGFTIGGGVTIRGAGVLTDNGGNATLQGTVKSDLGGDISFHGAGWNNQGLVEAFGGSTITTQFSLGSGGLILANGGTVNLSGLLTTASNVQNNGGAINLFGNLQSSSGSETLSGTWNLFGTIANCSLTFTGGGLVPSATASTLDNVTLNSFLLIPDGAQLIVRDGITLNNSVLIASNGAPTTLLFENDVNQAVSGPGKINFAGNVPQQDVISIDCTVGSLVIGSGIFIGGPSGNIKTFGAAGTLTLACSVDATAFGSSILIGGSNNIVVQGSMSATPGIIDFIGDYAATAVSSINVEIGAQGAGQFNVIGNAALGGTLNVLLDPFVPPTGTVYNIVTYSSSVGAFSNVLGLVQPGVNFTPMITPMQFSLNTTSGAPATSNGDLSLGSLGYRAGTYNAGDTFTVNVVEALNGSVGGTGGTQPIASPIGVPAFDVELVLSQDPVLGNNDDVILGDFPQAGFAAPASRNAMLSGIIPSGTPSGNYFVLAKIDPKNAVPETNESNNLAISPLADVIVPGQPTDLSLAAFSYQAGTYQPGDTLNVSGTIVNSGPGGTNAFDLKLLLSQDTTVGNRDDILLQTIPMSAIVGPSRTPERRRWSFPRIRRRGTITWFPSSTAEMPWPKRTRPTTSPSPRCRTSSCPSR